MAPYQDWGDEPKPTGSWEGFLLAVGVVAILLYILGVIR